MTRFGNNLGIRDERGCQGCIGATTPQGWHVQVVDCQCSLDDQLQQDICFTSIVWWRIRCY